MGLEAQDQGSEQQNLSYRAHTTMQAKLGGSGGATTPASLRQSSHRRAATAPLIPTVVSTASVV